MELWISPTPLAEPSGWLRLFAAFAIVVIFPGLFFFYRWFGRVGPIWLLGACATFGMLVIPLFGRLTEQLSLPFEPFGAVLFSAGTAYLLGRVAVVRQIVDGCFEPLLVERRRERWYELVVLAAAVSIFVLIVRAFAPLSAPPHVHDASNHAFLVARIVEIHSTAWREIFARPLNLPELRYLVGWHGTAAVVSQVSGVAPYIVTWQFAVLAAASLPLGFAVLWRHWGLSRGLVAAAAVVVASLDAHPLTDFRWGGFGLLVGLSLVGPAAVLMVQSVARRSTLVLVLTILSLLLIHAQAAWTAALLALSCWPSLCLFDRGRRWGWRQALVALAVLAFFIGPRLLELAGEYGTYRMTPPRGDPREVSRVLSEPLRQVARDVGMLALLFAGSLVFLLRRRLRPVFWLGLAFYALHFTLHRFRDPISLTLSTPLYQTPQRLLVSMLPVFVPMVVAAPMWLVERARHRWQRLLVAGLLLLVLFSNARHARRHIGKQLGGNFIADVVPFRESDYHFALRLRELVEPDAIVANVGDDGGRWVMHVSGRRFLVPTGWPQGAGRRRVGAAGLFQDPWPESTLRLRDRGVRYLFLSDRTLASPRGDGAVRARIDDDPRFCELLRGPESSLYRIEWEPPEAALDLPATVHFDDGFGPEEHFGRWAVDPISRFEVDLPPGAGALVLSYSGFPEQDGDQECELWSDDTMLASFRVPPRPWRWESLVVELSVESHARSQRFELRCARRWGVESRAYPLRALPIGALRTRRPPPCEPELTSAASPAARADAAHSR